MKPGPKRTAAWGLSPCPPQRKCAVCAAFTDKPEALRRLREVYVSGLPVWLVAQAFGVPNSALRTHAFFKNWSRRCSLNLPDLKHVLALALLTRMRDTWHLADGRSADRMLALLVKLAREEGTLSGFGEILPEEGLDPTRLLPAVRGGQRGP